MEIVRFKKEHLEKLKESSQISFSKKYLSSQQVIHIEGYRHSYSVLKGDRVLACYGVAEYWNGRGELWAFLSQNLKQDFIRIHSIAKEFIKNCGIDRLEAVVDYSFSEGHRWMSALGFKVEAPLMEKYSYTGGDCTLYSYIQGGM